MPGRNREAQLASDALFLARGDPFDVDAGGLQTVCEYFEVAVAANLEADPNKTGHIRLAQDDAGAIGFVEPAEKCQAKIGRTAVRERVVTYVVTLGVSLT